MEKFFVTSSALNFVELHVEILQGCGPDALTISDESEKEMLGPHVLVIQEYGLLSGNCEDLP